MKIGILTQPLFTNYGGILQCYALQKVLRRMGHEPIVLQREFDRRYTLLGACVYYAKLIVKKLLGRKESWHYYVSVRKRDLISEHTHMFIQKHIKSRSRHLYTTEALKEEVFHHEIKAIIVGSDQVWRPYYSPCQPNYFLDFLPDESPIKRIAYSASFGGDNWDWSPKLTEQCAKLLQKFDAVSVREQSGIRLCKEHFGVDAVQVLDPTMLLEPEDYMALINFQTLKPSNSSNSQTTPSRGTLFCYVLDRSTEKRAIIDTIASATDKKPFESMPELPDTSYNLYGDIDKCVYPPVEDWLSAFMEAEMVVTDSFHGTVFSIIFNKPFWVIGNEGRGMARFETLLSMYDLEDRLITPSSVSKIDFQKPIDWEHVNTIRKEQQSSSTMFIKQALN